jgi:hypothetical protein
MLKKRWSPPPVWKVNRVQKIKRFPKWLPPVNSQLLHLLVTSAYAQPAQRVIRGASVHREIGRERSHASLCLPTVCEWQPLLSLCVLFATQISLSLSYSKVHFLPLLFHERVSLSILFIHFKLPFELVRFSPPYIRVAVISLL